MDEPSKAPTARRLPNWYTHPDTCSIHIYFFFTSVYFQKHSVLRSVHAGHFRLCDTLDSDGRRILIITWTSTQKNAISAKNCNWALRPALWTKPLICTWLRCSCITPPPFLRACGRAQNRAFLLNKYCSGNSLMNVVWTRTHHLLPSHCN